MNKVDANQNSSSIFSPPTLIALVVGFGLGLFVRTILDIEPESACIEKIQYITYDMAVDWMDEYESYTIDILESEGGFGSEPEHSRHIQYGTNLESCVIEAINLARDYTDDDESIYHNMGGLQTLYGRHDDQQWAILFPLTESGAGFETQHFIDADGNQTESIVVVPIQNGQYEGGCPPLCDYRDFSIGG